MNRWKLVIGVMGLLAAGRLASGEDYSALVDAAERSYGQKKFAEAFRQFTEAESKLAKAVAGFRGVEFDFEGAAKDRFHGFRDVRPTKAQQQFASNSAILAGVHFHLGDMCAKGDGVARDAKAAFSWYRKAAQARGPGSAVGYEVLAARQVATAYLDGTGVERDYEQAFRWITTAHRRAWKLAGQQRGDAADTAMLGKSNFLNHAIRVLEPEAKQGNTTAQFYLGEIYSDTDVRDGKYTRRFANPTKATKWYTQSAAGNYVPAMLRLAELSTDAKKHDQAFRWYRKAADQGDSGAQAKVAACFYKGTGVAKDVAKGHEWMQKSVARNGPELYEFGKQFLLGEGTGPLSGESVQRDPERAIEILLLAAKLNHGRAQRALASVYSQGTFAPKDMAKARHWLFTAANNGDTDSQYLVGTIYDSGQDMFTGKKFPRNAKVAFRWFWLAANPGKQQERDYRYEPDQRAFYAVGVCFFHGNGVRKDVEKAKYWIRRAIDGDIVIADSAKDIPRMAQAFWDQHFK